MDITCTACIICDSRVLKIVFVCDVVDFAHVTILRAELVVARNNTVFSVRRGGWEGTKTKTRIF